MFEDVTVSDASEHEIIDGVTERRRAELAELFEMISAEVEKDNGTARIGDVDYAGGVVTVILGGACSSCSLTGATLEAGIVRILTQRLDWVREVRGVVDESAPVPGRNGWRPKDG